MGTRYVKGDKVRREEDGKVYEVQKIKKPHSESPTYVVERSGIKKFDKASSLQKVTDSDMPGINASDDEAVNRAEDKLQKKFEKFEEQNESFHFEKQVHDDDGFVVNILVDFGIEDYEMDAYYVGSVNSHIEDQPTDDPEEITQSNAFFTAQQIVDGAAGSGLTDAEGRRARWDIHEDPDHVDASRTIMYNESNMR